MALPTTDRIGPPATEPGAPQLAATKPPAGDKGIPLLANELWQLAVAYAKQETLDPLKALGRWFSLGIPGALLAAVGVVVGLLGVLRLVQVEALRHLSQRWSFLGYLAVIVAAGLVAYLAVRKIKPSSPEPAAAASSKGKDA